jgi:GNAT superfamily N-acetyltransferase
MPKVESGGGSGIDMNNINIEISTKADWAVVDDGIVEYNASKVPYTQEQAFEPINRVIRNEAGEVIAGINSMLYCWNCLYVDVLWVKEGFREKGYGSILLNEVEKIAKEKGCKLIHLDTFDFQAKDFYLKHGYEIFGVLEDCPSEHKRYYMKKKI